MIHGLAPARLFALLLLCAAGAAAREAAETETEKDLRGTCTGSRLPAVDQGDAGLTADLTQFDAVPGGMLEFEWQLTPVRTRRGVVYDLSFPSPRPTAVSENNTVWCRFYRAQTPGGADTPRPTAVVLHHLGGDFALEAALATYLSSQGIHALEIEFPYYGKRKPKGSDPVGDIMKKDVTTWIVPMQQVVADIRRAVDWLHARKDVDPERVGVVGVSLGGIIGALVCGVDQRLERNVLIIAGGDLTTIVNTPARETRAMRRSLEERGIDTDELRSLLRPIEPLRYAHRIDPRGMLMINAELDQVIVRAATDALIEAIDGPQVHWLRTDHYGIVLHLTDLFVLVRDHFREPASAPEGADEEFF